MASSMHAATVASEYTLSLIHICITQRVLTQTLRKLERNGMVTRTVLDGKTLGVEYALTPLGKSLESPFNALYDWTVEKMDEISACQARYDLADN